MSSQRLREAAKVLRERAQAEATGRSGPTPFALAVADWLEQHDDDHGCYECRWEPCAAFAVADSILGDPA